MDAISLSTIDLALIALYVGGIIAFGFVFTRRTISASDYFLASHQARWPIIGLSLVASNISPSALIGITGSAYAIGISVYNYEWMAAVVLALFAFAYLPILLRSRVYTMPEFLEQRYDGRARLWFAGLTLLLNMALDAAGGLYCGAVLLRQVAPALSLQEAAAILALLAGLYALAGGLRAVMYTEAVQAVIVLGSAFLLSALAFRHAGGWDAVMQAAGPSKLSLIRPADDDYMPWTGLLLGAPVLGFYFWCTNQGMVQRMLAARSLADGQRGALFAGMLKLLTLFAIVLPGIAAISLYPGLRHGDDAYPRMVFDLMPRGLLGLALAAFVGALMAQLSATYNSAATLVAMDFIRRARPALDGKALVRWGRIATGGCMIISILWAPQIDRFASLWQYMQAVMAYATPPVVALFGIGALWPRANAAGAFATILTGSGLGALLFALNLTGLVQVQFLHVAAILFAACAITLVVASLLTASPGKLAIAQPAAIRQDRPKGAPGLTVALFGTAAIILFWFR